MNTVLCILVLLSLSCCANAKEMCSLAQTLLKPAKNNRCFDQLISYTADVNDRKWLLSVRDKWNPPQDLRVQRVVGGAKIYRGEEYIGGFQWLSFNPPILYWNNEMKIGQKSKQRSISKIVDTLFHSQAVGSYIYQSILPQADAKEENKQLMEKITTIFTIGFLHGASYNLPLTTGTAREIMQSKANVRHWIQSYKELQSHIDCDKQGVQKYKTVVAKNNDYGPIDPLTQLGESKDSNNNIMISIDQKGEDVFEVSGLLSPNPKQKILITALAPSKSYCTTSQSTEFDSKYCDKAWKEMFANNPEMEIEYKKSDYAYFDCDAFEEKSKRTCYTFFSQKFKTYGSNENDVKIELCEDEACVKKTDINHLNYTEYLQFLNEHKLTAECGPVECTLPDGVKQLSLENRRKGLLLQKETRKSGDSHAIKDKLKKMRLHIIHAIESAALLGECCKDEECQKAARENQDIQIRTSNPAEQKASP